MTGILIPLRDLLCLLLLRMLWHLLLLLLLLRHLLLLLHRHSDLGGRWWRWSRRPAGVCSQNFFSRAEHLGLQSLELDVAQEARLRCGLTLVLSVGLV